MKLYDLSQDSTERKTTMINYKLNFTDLENDSFTKQLVKQGFPMHNNPVLEGKLKACEDLIVATIKAFESNVINKAQKDEVMNQVDKKLSNLF